MPHVRLARNASTAKLACASDLSGPIHHAADSSSDRLILEERGMLHWWWSRVPLYFVSSSRFRSGLLWPTSKLVSHSVNGHSSSPSTERGSCPGGATPICEKNGIRKCSRDPPNGSCSQL
jgi:hypothetical protein